jgi:hypothetical protein
MPISGERSWDQGVRIRSSDITLLPKPKSHNQTVCRPLKPKDVVQMPVAAARLKNAEGTLHGSSAARSIHAREPLFHTWFFQMIRRRGTGLLRPSA